MHVYRRYLRKILLHVPQTPIINRASRSHARKVEERGVPGGEGTRGIPDGRPADRLKIVPKMEVHFYMIRVPFWGSKMV